MAGESVGGITPYNMTMMPFYSGYTNSVALDSLPGFSGAFPGALSMDGSLFSGLGTNQYMPFWGGMNYEQYFNNMEMYTDFMYDSQLRRNQKSRQVDFLANSPMEEIHHQAEILREKIMQNEQQQIIPALNKYLESIKHAMGAEIMYLQNS